MKQIQTSAEVWAVIQARHRGNLKVFSSFSAPEGDYLGNSTQGRMETTYGLEGADYPLMKAKTTWDIDRNNHNQRINEKHEYWLCVNMAEEK